VIKMELVSSTLTAALVGVILVLTKVIEWFMSRNGNSKKQPKDYNGFSEVIIKVDTKLDRLSADIVELRQEKTQILEHLISSDSSHERIIERLGDVISSLERVTDNLSDLKEHIKKQN